MPNLGCSVHQGSGILVHGNRGPEVTKGYCPVVYRAETDGHLGQNLKFPFNYGIWKQ